MNNLHNWINTIAVGIVILVVLFGGHLAAPKAGNTTQSFWNAVQGYRVNGTEVISSSRAASFTTGAFSSSVGVASTSPFATLGIGSTGTSTIAGSKFCAFFATEAGQSFWIKLNPTGATLFSTSTTPCT